MDGRCTARQNYQQTRDAKVSANARDMMIVAPNSKVIRSEEAKTIAPPMMEKSSMKATYAENAILIFARSSFVSNSPKREEVDQCKHLSTCTAQG